MYVPPTKTYFEVDLLLTLVVKEKGRQTEFHSKKVYRLYASGKKILEAGLPYGMHKVSLASRTSLLM